MNTSPPSADLNLFAVRFAVTYASVSGRARESARVAVRTYALVSQSVEERQLTAEELLRPEGEMKRIAEWDERRWQAATALIEVVEALDSFVFSTPFASTSISWSEPQALSNRSEMLPITLRKVRVLWDDAMDSLNAAVAHTPGIDVLHETPSRFNRGVYRLPGSDPEGVLSRLQHVAPHVTGHFPRRLKNDESERAALPSFDPRNVREIGAILHAAADDIALVDAHPLAFQRFLPEFGPLPREAMSSWAEMQRAAQRLLAPGLASRDLSSSRRVEAIRWEAYKRYRLSEPQRANIRFSEFRAGLRKAASSQTALGKR